MGEKQPISISSGVVQAMEPKNIPLCDLKGKDGRPKNCPEDKPVLCSACKTDPKTLWGPPSGSLPLIYIFNKRFGIPVEEAKEIQQIVTTVSKKE